MIQIALAFIYLALISIIPLGVFALHGFADYVEQYVDEDIDNFVQTDSFEAMQIRVESEKSRFKAFKWLVA